jgi:hypothetical protein
MRTTIPEQIPDDINALKGIINNLEKNYRFKIKILEEKVSWLTSKLFGRKSEKFSAEDILQGRLFDEAGSTADEDTGEQRNEKAITVSSYTRKQGARKKLPDWINLNCYV